jgi:hypothetical protein
MNNLIMWLELQRLDHLQILHLASTNVYYKTASRVVTLIQIGHVNTTLDYPCNIL